MASPFPPVALVTGAGTGIGKAAAKALLQGGYRLVLTGRNIGKLQQAILTLPEKQRLVFNMKYFDEVKYEDMSEILGTSVGALKASYFHAVKKIEKYFGVS